MTDISVIKMIISVAVWRIYPSWVNGKLWAWEGLGHFGMFWARLSGNDFRSKLEIISFLSRVMFISKSFLFPALLQNLAPNVRALGLLVSTMSWSSLKTALRHLAFSCELRLRPRVFFENFFSFFKAEPVLLAWQLWWSPGWAKLFGGGSSKTRMETCFPGVGEIERRRTVDRRRFYYSTSRLRWSMVSKRDRSPMKSACDYPLSSTKTSEETSGFWGACFQDPMFLVPFCYSLFSCRWLYSHVGQAADRGQRRKAVIRDTSGVDHRAVTILSAPIWFTGRRHCTVFRHVMQLSLLVLR